MRRPYVFGLAIFLLRSSPPPCGEGLGWGSIGDAYASQRVHDFAPLPTLPHKGGAGGQVLVVEQVDDRPNKNSGAETKPEEEAGRRCTLPGSGFRYGLYEIRGINV